MKEHVVTQTSGKIDVKRFYIDAKININCPHCGAECVDDLSSNYLSYPEIGKVEDQYLYCESCDRDFEYKLKIKSVQTTIEYSTKDEL